MIYKKLVSAMMVCSLLVGVSFGLVSGEINAININENSSSYVNGENFTLIGDVPLETSEITVNGVSTDNGRGFNMNLKNDPKKDAINLKFMVKDSEGNVATRGNLKLEFETLDIKFQVGKSEIFVNDERHQMFAPVQIADGRAMVPFRNLAESFGAEVEWISDTKTVKFTFQKTEVSLAMGQDWAIVNGEETQLDIPAQIIDGLAVVPLRFVAESFGAGVFWDGSEKNIIIDKMLDYELTGDIPKSDDEVISGFDVKRIDLSESVFTVNISGRIPESSYIFINDNDVTRTVFSYTDSLKEAPSNNPATIKTFDDNRNLLLKKEINIENIKQTEYKISTTKPEIFVDGDIYSLDKPTQSAYGMPLIPISTLAKIFDFEVVATDDQKRVRFEYMGENIKITEKERFVETDTMPVYVPILPRVIDGEMYISYTSIPQVFKIRCTHNKDEGIIQIVRVIRPE